MQGVVTDGGVGWADQRVPRSKTDPPVLGDPLCECTDGGPNVHRRAARLLATVFIYYMGSQSHREGISKREKRTNS